MSDPASKKPSYSLDEVKKKIRRIEYRITLQAINDADTFFGWERKDIIECLLKLNDKYHLDDKDHNHFYKTDKNLNDPPHMMDVYRARKIKDDCNVYTHLYISNTEKIVVINSFKKLIGG